MKLYKRKKVNKQIQHWTGALVFQRLVRC